MEIFCHIRYLMYICIELFDEMQSAAVQRSYIVAKSLPTTFFLTTQRCHSDRYAKVSYPSAKIITILVFHKLFTSPIRNSLSRKRSFSLSRISFTTGILPHPMLHFHQEPRRPENHRKGLRQSSLLNDQNSIVSLIGHPKKEPAMWIN